MILLQKILLLVTSPEASELIDCFHQENIICLELLFLSNTSATSYDLHICWKAMTSIR